jgi:hypothetical protein
MEIGGFFMIGVSRLVQVLAKCLLKIGPATGSFSSSPDSFLGRKDFLPVEPPPQADLSFLFLLGAPRFA